MNLENLMKEGKKWQILKKKQQQPQQHQQQPQTTTSFQDIHGIWMKILNGEEDEPASIILEVDAAVEDAADFDASGIELPEGQMDACGVFEGDVVEVSGAKGAHTLCVVRQRDDDGVRRSA